MTPYTLAWDCHRCDPEMVSEQCRACLRWTKMPGQTFGPRTGTFSVEGAGMPGCRFSPILNDIHEVPSMQPDR